LKLHPTINNCQTSFTSIGEGYVAVNGRRFNQAIVVTPEQVLTDWNAADIASLAPEHFDYFLAFTPEVVIFGTGSRQHFPHPQLYRRLIDARIAIEFMDTPAACRTYNILVAEDRKVVAAILL
jgi:uncharacterized protein